MNDYQEKVERFHLATGSTIGTTPELRDRDLRAKLIMEEAVETVAAMGFDVHARIEEIGIPGETAHREVARFAKYYKRPEFLDVIDGLCDLLYVTFGTAVAAGIDLDPFFEEVHRANMDKLKGPKREDGKQLKPDGWQGPDHAPILALEALYAQAWADIRGEVAEGEVVG